MGTPWLRHSVLWLQDWYDADAVEENGCEVCGPRITTASNSLTECILPGGIVYNDNITSNYVVSFLQQNRRESWPAALDLNVLIEHLYIHKRLFKRPFGGTLKGTAVSEVT